MQQVLASALPEKPVLSSDGRQLGIVHNITMNLHTGELNDLIIETDRPVSDFADIERNDDGHLRVSADHITGLDDHVVVSFAKTEEEPIS